MSSRLFWITSAVSSSTSSLQNFRLRCLQSGNHSLRRGALLTGRASTEPSERGQNLLTLHKISDIFLSCLCFLLDLQTLYSKFTANVWKRGTETTSVIRIHSLFYFC